ncbi:MAG: rhomboid family intramembrane serine protease [Chloroflexi bacterium]|nr:rhomboid family intramembrane serine protease [Chloroflexota bacterium]
MNEIPASPSDLETGAAPSGTIALRLPAVNARVTNVILGLTIFIYVLQVLGEYWLGFDVMAALGAKSNEAIRAGELWRLFTPILLHGPIWHIGFNMYALYSLGTGLEWRMGHGRFLLLYLLAGFAGNVFSFLITPGQSVGASTSIFGLIAAEGIFLYQNRRLFGKESRQAMNNIIFVIIFNLFLGFSGGGLIDNWGHVGGLLGGAVFTWFAGPLWQVVGNFPDLRLADQREFRDVVLGAGTVIIIFSALAVWGMSLS